MKSKILAFVRGLFMWTLLFLVFHLLHLDDPASFFLALILTLVAAGSLGHNSGEYSSD